MLQARSVPHRGRSVQGPGLDEGGGGAGDRDAGQEQRLLRGVDPEQHQDCRL